MTTPPFCKKEGEHLAPLFPSRKNIIVYPTKLTRYDPFPRFSSHSYPFSIAFHCALVPLKVIVVRPLQLENAPDPMLVTLSGIVTEVKPLQLENAKTSMLVTEFGIVTVVKWVQVANTEASMLATLSGIVTEVKPLQP